MRLDEDIIPQLPKGNNLKRIKMTLQNEMMMKHFNMTQ